MAEVIPLELIELISLGLMAEVMAPDEVVAPLVDVSVLDELVVAVVEPHAVRTRAMAPAAPRTASRFPIMGGAPS